MAEADFLQRYTPAVRNLVSVQHTYSSTILSDARCPFSAYDRILIGTWHMIHDTGTAGYLWGETHQLQTMPDTSTCMHHKGIALITAVPGVHAPDSRLKTQMIRSHVTCNVQPPKASKRQLKATAVHRFDPTPSLILRSGRRGLWQPPKPELSHAGRWQTRSALSCREIRGRHIGHNTSRHLFAETNMYELRRTFRYDGVYNGYLYLVPWYQVQYTRINEHVG